MKPPRKIPCPATRADLYKAMSPACREAFEAYDRTYLGGLGGGWHTSARAFIAAWDAADGDKPRKRP